MSRFAAALLSLSFAASANAQTATPPSTGTATASTRPTAPAIKAEPPAGPNMALVGVGAGLSATLLVTGAVFTVLPNVKTSVVANTIDDRVFFINAGAWSFIAASALGAATIVYTIVTSNQAKTGARATPVITASGGGLVLSGDL